MSTAAPQKEPVPQTSGAEYGAQSAVSQTAKLAAAGARAITPALQRRP